MKTTILSSLILCIGLVAIQKKEKSITTLEGLKKVMKGYSYIPSGKVIMSNDTVSVQGFFMFKTEVSNMNYKEYLMHLKKQGKLDEYHAALPDTAQWINYGPPLKKFADYYFSHPAYRDYPVVNLTYEQAKGFCTFLTEVWRKKTGNEKILFRIPERAEFLRAAFGTSLERPYSWNHPYLQSSNGNVMCNYLRIGEGAIIRDTTNGKLKIDLSHAILLEFDQLSTDITAPVKSFYPNEYNLYNLNGNVSEMVANGHLVVGGDWYSPGGDVNNYAHKAFKQANPMVGFRPVMTYLED
jgi:formylglycine-generating enzyme required for sulfatase activity